MIYGVKCEFADIFNNNNNINIYLVYIKMIAIKLK